MTHIVPKPTGDFRKDFALRFMLEAEEQARKFAPMSLNATRDMILTQAAHESDWNRSGLSIQHNNMFGMKTGEKWLKAGRPVAWMPTKDFINGAWTTVQQPFRKYDTTQASFEDWYNLLVGWPSKYGPATAALKASNFAAFFKALDDGGYDGPEYAKRLTGVLPLVERAVV